MFEVVLLVLLICLNGVFSMSEMAVVSARRARLQQLAGAGNAGAQTALALAEEPTRFLSTVQIGITLIGTLTGALGGAALSAPLSAYFDRIPALAAYSQPLSLVIVVLSITYLSLVLGELAPKRLALFNPERVAAAVAGPMSLLSRIARPIVSVLATSTDLLLRLLGPRHQPEPPVTAEEINALMNEGTQAGVFEKSERDMIQGVFRLDERSVVSLLTPRPEIVWLDLEAAAEENRRKILATPYSRFPVAKGSLDEVLGIVDTRDLYAARLAGQPFDLTANLVTPLFVPEATSVLQLLERFKQTGVHLALVVDEYGGIQGLVTMTDVVEAIVGDLPAADEPYEPDIVQRADGSWLVDGLTGVDDLREVLGVREFPGEAEGNYQTVGGLVMMQLGRIPAAGDSFEWGGFRFEVVDMDERRVDKVWISRSPDAGQPGTTSPVESMPG